MNKLKLMTLISILVLSGCGGGGGSGSTSSSASDTAVKSNQVELSDLIVTNFTVAEPMMLSFLAQETFGDGSFGNEFQPSSEEPKEEPQEEQWEEQPTGITTTPVPEPGTMVLLTAGLVGFAALRLNRRKKNKL